MGMFDHIVCKYPLPLEGANQIVYQTKDTPSQFLDDYEIREDGTLWRQEYDIEDRSKVGEWERDHPGEELPEELKRLEYHIGCLARVNEHWIAENHTGEIRFYNAYGYKESGWVEWSAYFVNGILKELNLLENTKPHNETD